MQRRHGKITFTGKKRTSRYLNVSIPFSRKSKESHSKALESLSRSNMLFRDIGLEGLTMSTEWFIKFIKIPCLLLNSATTTDLAHNARLSVMRKASNKATNKALLPDDLSFAILFHRLIFQPKPGNSYGRPDTSLLSSLGSTQNSAHHRYTRSS